MFNLTGAMWVDKSIIVSWMLYPNPLDDDQRLAIRRAIDRTRYLNIVEATKKPQKSQPYRWVETSKNELTLESNLPEPESGIFSKILPDDEGVAFELISRMLEEERSSKNKEVKSFQLAYRKGFTAGCVLLCSYIYDSDFSTERNSSQAKSESATQNITKMKAKSVQNFFRDFNSVAHFWSAYHICTPYRFTEASDRGIMEYSSKEVQFDFLDQIDYEKFLSNAAELIKHGLTKNTAKTTLINSETVLGMTFLPEAPNSLSISREILDNVQKSYLPGKRENASTGRF